MASEDEDYAPIIPSNVNLLNDLFRTSDEDTMGEEQEADLKKLSSGLTIRPVESSAEHKNKWVHSSEFSEINFLNTDQGELYFQFPGEIGNR